MEILEKREKNAVDVQIMGREFRIACPPEERDFLMRAVDIVDSRMNSIRDSGRVVGIDRIAVMAAMQIAHDIIKQQMGDGSPSLALDNEILQRKIVSIVENIDEVLGN